MSEHHKFIVNDGAMVNIGIGRASQAERDERSADRRFVIYGTKVEMVALRDAIGRAIEMGEGDTARPCMGFRNVTIAIKD